MLSLRIQTDVTKNRWVSTSYRVCGVTAEGISVESGAFRCLDDAEQELARLTTSWTRIQETA